MAASVQSAAAQLLDLSVGSVIRSVLEANASLGLWLQWLILQVLQSTRAATSNGPDLDSWMADMTLTRLPAVPAGGGVTFSRFTPTLPAFIPAGALIRTADGQQTFAVSTDISNPAWNPALNGYSIGANVASLTIPVIAQAAGSLGNVQAGSVTLLVTAIPGVDTVINPAAFQNGLDAESDPALRVRFQNFVQSRSRATILAITYAVTSIQQGLNCVIQENVDSTGAPRMGNFVLTVDDGSGTPSTGLLSTVVAAIDAVRPIGSTFSVQGPIVTKANVSLLLTVSAPAAKSQVIPIVTDAIERYINALPIAAALPVTKVAQIAYDASPGIANVSQVMINGLIADIAALPTGVIKAGIVAIN